VEFERHKDSQFRQGNTATVSAIPHGVDCVSGSASTRELKVCGVRFRKF